MSFRINESNYPLVVVTAEGEPTQQTISDYITSMGTLLKRTEPHAIVLDVRTISSLGSDIRQQVTRWSEKNRVELAKKRVGYALVSSSVWTRSLVPAVYWINPPPFPYRTFATMEPALQWTRIQLGMKR